LAPRRSRFAPTSRAVLIVGGLGFAWLALAGLLVLEWEATRGAPAAPPTPSAHAVAVQAATVQAIQPAALAAFPPAHDGPALSPAFDSAFDEPLVEEVAALLGHLYPGLGEPGARIEPVLEGYTRTLAARMNAHGGTFVATFSAPDVRVARRRAARAHALLVEAGVRPWLLEAVGEAGPEALAVEPG